MTKIQLHLEREAVKEERKKAAEGNSTEREEIMECQDEKLQTGKEKAQSEEGQTE